MKCPNCGKELPDTAAFCGECGTKIDRSAATDSHKDEGAGTASNTNPDTSSVSDASNVSDGQVASSQIPSQVAAFFKTRAAKIVIPVVVAVVLVAVVFSIFSNKASLVPEDTVKAALKSETSIMDGAVPGNYVKDSKYELKDFSIDEHNSYEPTVAGTDASMGYEADNITFSGTIENDNFKTTFNGTATFYRRTNVKNANWQVDSISIDETNTEPLKGVDYIDSDQDESNDTTTKYSDFSSDLNEEDGVYTSKASQKVSTNYWFASDTYTETCNFVFNQETGWGHDTDVDESKTSTSYKLEGMSFSLDEGSLDKRPDLSWYNYTNASTITIDKIDGDTVSASYTFDSHFSASESSFYADDYKPVSFSGSLTGTLVHDIGDDTFSVELKDDSNGVTILLRSSYYSTDDDAPDESLTADISTTTAFYDDDKFSMTGLTYVQKS